MPSSRSITSSSSSSGSRNAHIATIVTLAVCVSTSLQLASARPEYVEMIPNGANVPGVAALGHVNGIGAGEHNAFGEGFTATGNKWTKAFCEEDSDGDGQHNGAELGDPCCEWTLKTNQRVEWIEGVSSPADATHKSDPALWAKINCTTTTNLDSTATAPSATTAVPTTSGAAAAFLGTAAGLLTTASLASAVVLLFV